MGFVKTPEEIARLQAVMAEPRALDGEMVIVEFDVEPAISKRLLPPGLESLPTPTGLAFAGRWERSNASAYDGGGVMLKARHGDIEGLYALSMPVNTDSALLFGRDMMGEPKKLFDTSFERTGDDVSVSIARHGQVVLRLQATLEQELPAASTVLHHFHYKYSHRVDGRGLDYDPMLVCNRIEQEVHRLEIGRGTLELVSTPHDPLGELGRVEPSYAALIRADTRASSRVLTSVPAEEFLPYAFSKLDDWTVLDGE